MNPIVFAPDADPTAPGVIVSATNIVPTLRGYRSALTPSPISVAIPGLVDTSITSGAAFLRNLSNVPRTYVATNERIRLYDAGWTDVSKSGGYSLPAQTRWTFRQFGNVSLAAGWGQPIQARTSGSFADISGAPQVKFLAVCSGFVIGYSLSTQADGWHCSALEDHTDWTPALATQSATGRFFDTPGPITGARELGDQVIVFKERSMYRHRYVNVPVIWASECIDNEIGAICDAAIVDVGNQLVFIGEHNIYLFDGTRPVPIGDAIREWFFSRLWWSNRWYTVGGLDRDRMLVYFWYIPVGSPDPQPTEGIVYDLKSGKWGVVSGFKVTDTLSYAIDTGLGLANREALHVMSENKLCSLTGDAASATLRLGWMGNDETASTMTKLRPRFIRKPVSATADFYKSEAPDVVEERLVGSASLKEGAFGTQQNAHWHSARVTIPGRFEMTAIGNDLPRPAGKR